MYIEDSLNLRLLKKCLLMFIHTAEIGLEITISKRETQDFMKVPEMTERDKIHLEMFITGHVS